MAGHASAAPSLTVFEEKDEESEDGAARAEQQRPASVPSAAAATQSQSISSDDAAAAAAAVGSLLASPTASSRRRKATVSFSDNPITEPTTASASAPASAPTGTTAGTASRRRRRTTSKSQLQEEDEEAIAAAESIEQAAIAARASTSTSTSTSTPASAASSASSAGVGAAAAAAAVMSGSPVAAAAAAGSSPSSASGSPVLASAGSGASLLASLGGTAASAAPSGAAEPEPTAPSATAPAAAAAAAVPPSALASASRGANITLASTGDAHQRPTRDRSSSIAPLHPPSSMTAQASAAGPSSSTPSPSSSNLASPTMASLLAAQSPISSSVNAEAVAKIAKVNSSRPYSAGGGANTASNSSSGGSSSSSSSSGGGGVGAAAGGMMGSTGAAQGVAGGTGVPGMRPLGSSSGEFVGLYDFKETLGRGHFAVVKLAEHVFTGEQVAVKIIDKTKLDDVAKRHLFQEVRCMKILNHPHVIRLFEVMDTAAKLYIIMEWGAGGDLYETITRNGKLEEDVARSYFRQILSAIEFCHSLHIVHRDLKPENILFSGGSIKITDFGFSNSYEQGQKLQTACGSLAYSPPEVLLGDEYDGPAVDIWSLGVILYMMVCGSLPFQEAGASETIVHIMEGRFTIPAHVSSECADLIRGMLIVEPTKRMSLSVIKQTAWITAADDTPIEVKEPVFDIANLPPHEQELVFQRLKEIDIDRETVLKSLASDAYDHVTATFYLLAHQHMKRLQKKPPPMLNNLKRKNSLPYRLPSTDSGLIELRARLEEDGADDAPSPRGLASESGSFAPRLSARNSSGGLFDSRNRNASPSSSPFASPRKPSTPESGALGSPGFSRVRSHTLNSSSLGPSPLSGGLSSGLSSGGAGGRLGEATNLPSISTSPSKNASHLLAGKGFLGHASPDVRLDVSDHGGYGSAPQSPSTRGPVQPLPQPRRSMTPDAIFNFEFDNHHSSESPAAPAPLQAPAVTSLAQSLLPQRRGSLTLIGRPAVASFAEEASDEEGAEEDAKEDEAEEEEKASEAGGDDDESDSTPPLTLDSTTKWPTSTAGARETGTFRRQPGAAPPSAPSSADTSIETVLASSAPSSSKMSNGTFPRSTSLSGIVALASSDQPGAAKMASPQDESSATQFSPLGANAQKSRMSLSAQHLSAAVQQGGASAPLNIKATRVTPLSSFKAFGASSGSGLASPIFVRRASSASISFDNRPSPVATPSPKSPTLTPSLTPSADAFVNGSPLSAVVNNADPPASPSRIASAETAAAKSPSTTTYAAYVAAHGRPTNHIFTPVASSAKASSVPLGLDLSGTPSPAPILQASVGVSPASTHATSSPSATALSSESTLEPDSSQSAPSPAHSAFSMRLGGADTKPEARQAPTPNLDIPLLSQSSLPLLPTPVPASGAAVVPAMSSSAAVVVQDSKNSFRHSDPFPDVGTAAPAHGTLPHHANAGSPSNESNTSHPLRLSTTVATRQSSHGSADSASSPSTTLPPPTQNHALVDPFGKPSTSHRHSALALAPFDSLSMTASDSSDSLGSITMTNLVSDRRAGSMGWGEDFPAGQASPVQPHGSFSQHNPSMKAAPSSPNSAPSLLLAVHRKNSSPAPVAAPSSPSAASPSSAERLSGKAKDASVAGGSRLSVHRGSFLGSRANKQQDRSVDRTSLLDNTDEHIEANDAGTSSPFAIDPLPGHLEEEAPGGLDFEDARVPGAFSSSLASSTSDLHHHSSGEHTPSTRASTERLNYALDNPDSSNLISKPELNQRRRKQALRVLGNPERDGARSQLFCPGGSCVVM
ncbi:snrk protein [Capsaspora owczarzaki ATCC 30864]|uniref:CAMK/CAMKL/SNRK protein kinase n=1 Tax=Capsaspora owczarzaki (strain ATCC 30864) TaxID=595528 RepID=A0A0D2VXP4_CAPO3|nr:snrk protein [Capsaspora owczarzaki ATCC 30864]KJE96447.1 CAMK/CAMKL/SNRK protein kinase [Capsaspora owczarzaki ATCC 30864]|eukprot:XP_004344393.2 snrk protein [Capsaspora owczarzaki ATCC 30864]